MTRRLLTCAVLAATAALAASAPARAEVFAHVDRDGRFVSVRTVVGRNVESRLWEPVGAAERSGFVLNPNGDLRGDGRPDIAVNPATNLPTAVWAKRFGRDFEIVSSTFDGVSWSAPITVRVNSAVDDLDPKIVFRRDGYAIVTWWQRSTNPVVRMALLIPEGVWYDGGVISAPGVGARLPSVRQEGMMTIVAYRTARDIGIVTFVAGQINSDFGDGPTPFPQDNGGGDEGVPGDPPDLDN